MASAPVKRIFYVTEGKTDQLVIDALVARWLGDEDFIPTAIQPPESAYADGTETRLSQGWKGVLAWCANVVVRDDVIARADCLFIHMDADVAGDPNLKDPPFAAGCPPASAASNWVRAELGARLPMPCPTNVVLCVPAHDLEAWVLTALRPDVADANAPVECCTVTDDLVAANTRPRLIVYKQGRARKERRRYQEALDDIVDGWTNCTDGLPPRCAEAVRFEAEARAALSS